jgi:SAM-dependent methyltransferase
MVLQSAYRRVHSAVMELYLGIQTTGSQRVPPGAVFIPYVPIPYRAIFPILERVGLTSDDVLVDVGCGKGRMVCCASRWPARKVVGIDFDAALVEDARRNASRVRGRKAEIECRHARAEEFDYGDATVIYLYHPFERSIMELFLTRVAETRQRHRPLRIVYANAVHNLAFEESGWLYREDDWVSGKIGGFPYDVTFWSSRP